MKSQAPAWVLPGAKYDLDFKNERYWGGKVNRGTRPLTGLIGYNVASSNPGTIATGSPTAGNSAMYARNADGLYLIFPVVGLRIVRGLGIWVERDSANNMFWCSDFTKTDWVKDGVTPLKNQTGPDGVANSASLLTATKDNATVLQTEPGTAFWDPHNVTTRAVTSALVKRVSGSGPVYLTQDNGVTQTDITSQIDGVGFRLAQLPYQTKPSTVVAGFKFATSGDSIAVWAFQSEPGSYPTQPLFTTNAIFRRGAVSVSEHVIFNQTSTPRFNDGWLIHRDTDWGRNPVSMYAEFCGNQSEGITHQVIGQTNESFHVSTTGDMGTTIAISGSDVVGGKLPAETTNVTLIGHGNINKVTTRQHRARSSICLNGGPIAYGQQGIPAPAATNDHGGLGNNGTGYYAMDGWFPRIALFTRYINDNEMINWTR